jgi:hypothetical protein
MRDRHEDPLPPALADLREQFRAAAARELAVEREVERRVQVRTRRRRRPARLASIVAAAVFALAGVAFAAGLLDRDGPSLAPEGQALDGQSADPGVIVSSAVPDPGGGPPWALKLVSNDRGEECVLVGRLRDGVLGRVRDGVFQPLPAVAQGFCADLSQEPLLAAVEQWPHPTRTVIYGVSRGRGTVDVTIGGSRTRLRTAGLGTYLFVRRGKLDPGGASVSARIDGRRVVHPLD